MTPSVLVLEPIIALKFLWKFLSGKVLKMFILKQTNKLTIDCMNYEFACRIGELHSYGKYKFKTISFRVLFHDFS